MRYGPSLFFNFHIIFDWGFCTLLLHQWPFPSEFLVPWKLYAVCIFVSSQNKKGIKIETDGTVFERAPFLHFVFMHRFFSLVWRKKDEIEEAWNVTLATLVPLHRVKFNELLRCSNEVKSQVKSVSARERERE